MNPSKASTPSRRVSSKRVSSASWKTEARSSSPRTSWRSWKSSARMWASSLRANWCWKTPWKASRGRALWKRRSSAPRERRRADAVAWNGWNRRCSLTRYDAELETRAAADLAANPPGGKCPQAQSHGRRLCRLRAHRAVRRPRFYRHSFRGLCPASRKYHVQPAGLGFLGGVQLLSLAGGTRRGGPARRPGGYLPPAAPSCVPAGGLHDQLFVLLRHSGEYRRPGGGYGSGVRPGGSPARHAAHDPSGSRLSPNHHRMGSSPPHVVSESVPQPPPPRMAEHRGRPVSRPRRATAESRQPRQNGHAPGCGLLLTESKTQGEIRSRMGGAPPGCKVRY